MFRGVPGRRGAKTPADMGRRGAIIVLGMSPLGVILLVVGILAVVLLMLVPILGWARRRSRRIEAELAAELAPLGLTVTRLGLLGHISAASGASFSELARRSGTSVQSVHAAVKALAGAGLVRDGTARAGAASRIEVTAEGARLLRSAKGAVAAVDARLFGPGADPLMSRIGAAAHLQED